MIKTKSSKDIVKINVDLSKYVKTKGELVSIPFSKKSKASVEVGPPSRRNFSFCLGLSHSWFQVERQITVAQSQ